MLARKCDCCKKLYEHYGGSDIFNKGQAANALILIDRDIENKYWRRKTWDLCPTCMEKIEALLSSGGEKSG